VTEPGGAAATFRVTRDGGTVRASAAQGGDFQLRLVGVPAVAAVTGGNLVPSDQGVSVSVHGGECVIALAG
jgi:hypothetical protein